MVSNMLVPQQMWYEKFRADDAEKAYYESLSGASTSQTKGNQSTGSSLASEIARAREQIQKSLKAESAGPAGAMDSAIVSRLEALELENNTLKQVTSDLQAAVKKLEEKIKALETSPATTKAAAPAAKAPAPKAPAKDDDDDDDDDDDFDLFGDDGEDDDEEAERVKAERVKAYEAKKANKPKVVAKSSLVLEVKPWDDETDLKEMERLVRTIEIDGLLWGASKLVPVGYGINKLQIGAVIEDEKVRTDDLEEQITGFEDYVQSMDIAAFNKI